ncbi:MAG: hypothetical protein FXF49_06700 [Flexistipes sinusarabici]|uniref:Uncharacterized protein n=1 Tax=Flexistipes sinusarabici TaxID=2352 RepID=A0A5D0MPC8_FLESI|nr:hypothetical protein [Flexistipes sinusarabici]TYB33370.1 MAG: hypothetical protein FXF49_06700 [Flexistipes sinusarabici]
MNDKINSEIYEKLELLGIKFGEPDENKRQLSAQFHFNGNFGFYHISDERCEFLILKGIFKDNIRLLKGKVGIQPKKLSKIADRLSNIEKNLDFAPVVKFFIDDDIYISDISRDPSSQVENLQNFDPRKVPASLSEVEFSLQHSDFARDKNLYFKGLLSELLPETLSPLSRSILNELPDILNPIFAHAGFKTYSPSVKLIVGKMYTNLSNLQLAFNTMEAGDDFLKMNFAPSLYMKNPRKKFKNLNLDLLDIQIDEIEAYSRELRDSVQSVSFENLHNGTLSEHLALFAMLGQMIFFRLSSVFIKILRRVKNLQLAAELIYKTRDSNLFAKLSGKRVPKYFDVFAPYAEFPDEIGYEKKSLDEVTAKMGFFKKARHGENLRQAVKAAHRFLDKRDELIMTAIDYFEAVDKVLHETGRELVEKRQITKPEQLYWLELNEIKNIKKSDYYGNIPFSLYFKSVQHERYKAQFSPNLIYEKDINRIPDIFDGLISKYNKKTEVLCRALNPVKEKTFVYNGENISTQSGVAVFGRLPFSEIPMLKDIEWIICDYAPLLSLLFEYACITDKSLYAGMNGSEVFLRGKKITLNEDRLVIEKTD